jgi:hypothetical protein
VWESLRQQVRQARQIRGVSVATLAGEIGLAVSTVTSALEIRKPASTRIQSLLRDWLDKAPEVAAAPSEPFCPNGARHGTVGGGASGSAGGNGTGLLST